MEVVNRALDDYEQECGLPKPQKPCDSDEIDKYFNMTRDQIEKLTAEDCGQIAYRLSQMSFHIQRLFNREKSRMTWAKSKLDSMVAAESQQYDKWTKYEVKVELIKRQNIYANSLGKILTYAQQRIDRLTSISIQIHNLANVLLANKRDKYVKN